MYQIPILQIRPEPDLAGFVYPNSARVRAGFGEILIYSTLQSQVTAHTISCMYFKNMHHAMLVLWYHNCLHRCH